MSAGSRIFIVVLVLAFLGTGLYYLVIADSKGPTPALEPSVAEPAPKVSAQPVAPIASEALPAIESPIASDTLAVRVAVPASDPVGVDVPDRRKQFVEDGPDGMPNAKAEWFPLFDLGLFVENEGQQAALAQDPVSYFQERFGLIVEPNAEALYVLLYTTPGRSVAPSDYRGVEVLSVCAVDEATAGARPKLEIELGTQAAQRLTRAADKNISRMWAILVDDVIVEIQRITGGEKTELTLASGFTPATMSELEEAISGNISIHPATFIPVPKAVVAEEASPEIDSASDPILAASRTSTIESNDESSASTPVQETKPVATTTPAPAANTTYVVKAGDTMSSIAAEWFGSARQWSEIAEANPQVDPNRLSIGEVLVLPPKNAPAAAPAKKPVGGQSYTVKSGDNLAKISQALYGSEAHWKLLYNANKDLIGPNPEALKVGAVLAVPALPKKSS